MHLNLLQTLRVPAGNVVYAKAYLLCLCFLAVLSVTVFMLVGNAVRLSCSNKHTLPYLPFA